MYKFLIMGFYIKLELIQYFNMLFNIELRNLKLMYSIMYLYVKNCLLYK